jgi:AraC-like DNA-binding protein
MLEGYDDDWVNAPQTRIARYAEVPAGTYIFKVKAFVIDSPEKYDMKEIEVIVPAPFFLSQRSIWLYMAIGVVIIVLFMFWRQSRIKSRLKKAQQQAALQEMAKHRSEEDKKFMVILYEWMNDHSTERRIDANEILKMLDMTQADFEEHIKRLTGFTPKAFIFDFRLTKSQQMLEDTDADIDDIAKRVGFRDGETFVRLFHEKYNMLPNEYRITHHNSHTDAESYEIIE